VQLIAYAQDPLLPQLEAALTEFSSSPIWALQTVEYGVGPLNVRPTIAIAGTPPAMLDDNTGNVTPFQSTLAANLSGANPAWGAADPNTIYLFVLPTGTQIDSGGLCCDPGGGFFGYHYEAKVGSTKVAYAVACNCPGFVTPTFTALQNVTSTMSHELVEAATDPFYASTPAFGAVDDPHTIWNTGSFGGEVSDMCQSLASANLTPAGATYTIQRSWSNAAARAGTDPCVPAPSEPYFNSYPTLPDLVTILDPSGTPVMTKGVKIAVGQTRTIDVVLKSAGPTAGPWNVSVQDLSEYTGAPAKTQVSLDKTSGINGEVLHLTIKVLGVDQNIGGEGFVLSSTLGGQDTLWFGAVGQ
jgi:hypothetical protein